MADNVLASPNGIANAPSVLGLAGLTPLRGDPRQEYVSGSAGGSWTWPWLQRLPLPDDDLETLLGSDVYARMLNDPQVFSSTMLLITLVMRRGLRLDPAYEDASRDSTEYKRSLEIKQFCERAFGNLEKHIDTVLFEMLQGALPYGSAVAEIRMEQGSGYDRNKLLFKSIKVKPREVYAYVVDPYFNLVGIAIWVGPPSAWLDEMISHIGNQTFIPTAALAGNKWALLERDNPQGGRNFAHLAVLTRNNDPRGTSWLRAAYNSWYEKMKLWPELDLFWQRFAGPGLVGTAAPNAGAQYPLDANGNPDTTQPKVSAERALLNAMTAYHNGDAVALPNGAAMNVIQNANDGGAFMGGIHLCDGQINKAITFQDLANTSGKVMSRNASEVHQDVLFNPVLYLRFLCLAPMVVQDFLRPLIKINFGVGDLKYTPKPNLGRVAPEDVARLMEALGNGMQKGGGHWTQLPKMWADFDMPLPDMEIWLTEIMLEKAILAQTGLPAAGAPGADAAAPQAPANGAPATAPAVAPADGVAPQSELSKYAVQETGKRLTRMLAARIAGKMTGVG